MTDQELRDLVASLVVELKRYHILMWYHILKMHIPKLKRCAEDNHCLRNYKVYAGIAGFKTPEDVNR